MKKITLFIVAGAILSACDSTTPKFHVEGNIEGAQDSMLYLEVNALDGTHKIDSVRLKADGSFSFSANAPIYTSDDSVQTSAVTYCPEFYSLRIGNKSIPFSVDSTETITFKAKFETMNTDYTVEGSESSKKIKEIYNLQQNVQQRIIALEKDDNLLPGDMIDSVRNCLQTYKETMKQKYIFPDPSRACAYYAVCQCITDYYSNTFQLFNPITDRNDVKCYAAVATSWDYNYHDAPRTQQLCNMAIKGMDNTAVPQQKLLQLDTSKIAETGIIDVNLPDINSKVRKITDLKGKVVMLDFTMYGAEASAERTRILRDIYNKYHSQGFEIYQVSLDEDIHFWKSSVEYLPWVCVHETNGSATKAYGVVDLPTYFLIDRNNEVFGRSGLMEGTLEEQVKKLL